jgi:hypothetical protein
MKTINPASFLASVVLALLTLGSLTGCASKGSSAPPKKGPGYKYIIKLHAESLAGQRFTVDVIGVNSVNKDRITSLSVDDYFNDKDKLRSGIVTRVASQVIGDGADLVVDLEDKSPEKKGNLQYRYPGFSHIAIIADSTVRGTNPADDLRRILLPLDINSWQRDWPGKKREITVTFSSSGPQVTPAPVPASK